MTQVEELQKRLNDLKAVEKAQAQDLEKIIEKSERTTADGKRAKNKESCHCKCLII
jgi:hypothetical protein